MKPTTTTTREPVATTADLEVDLLGEESGYTVRFRSGRRDFTITTGQLFDLAERVRELLIAKRTGPAAAVGGRS